MEKQVLNKTFNELTVRKFINKPDTNKYKSWNTNTWVHCECSCGREIDLPLCGVINGRIKSCGHLRIAKAMIQLEEIRKSNPTPTAIYLTHEGKTMNISEWAKETGIPRSTITYRINKELPIEKVLERKDDDGQNQQKT